MKQFTVIQTGPLQDELGSMHDSDWATLEFDRDGDAAATAGAIERLANGEIPAIVFRQVLPPGEPAAIVQLLIEQGLMFATTDQVVEKQTVASAVTDQWTHTNLNPPESTRKRIDIGSSLGNIGGDQEHFLRHAAESRSLFDRLFADRLNPISILYDHLQWLAPNQRVVTAYEPDGRQYGPAIIRVHYGGYQYGPHFDSVRLRESRSNYAVYRFPHQFAGVLCLQNASRGGLTAQGIIHNRLWDEDVDPYLKSGRFPEFAARQGIASAQVDLEPGDLYYFNTRNIHEVPGVPGDQPRVVLATFIGYGPHDDEMMVWS